MSREARRGRVVAVVMAAGRSRRFGDADKRLARLPDGRPMLAAVAAQAERVFDATRVVLRDDDQPACLGLPPSSVTIRAANADAGLGASLSAAFAALGRDGALDDCEAAAVLLADMPLLRVETLAALRAQAGREIILRPVAGGRPGHPVVFGRRFWPAMERLSGDEGGRSVIRTHREACRELAVDDPGIHADVDTREALARLSAWPGK